MHAQDKYSAALPGGGRYLQRPPLARWEWVAVLLIVATFFLIRLHRLDIPMERDEGEYAYAGQLLLQGKLPYVELYNMKLPGAYLSNAAIQAVLGQTGRGVHLGHALFNLATMLLIWRIGRRLDRPLTGLAAAAFFGVLSMNRFILGLHAHAEHFLVFWMLLGLLLALPAIYARSWKHTLLGGLCLGLAVLMKQHGLAFVLMIGLMVIGERFRHRRESGVPGPGATLVDGLTFLGACLLPYGLVCLVYLVVGEFERFWFWTFEYARIYSSLKPPEEFNTALKTGVLAASDTIWPLWIFCLGGLAALPLRSLMPRFRQRRQPWLLFLLLLLFGAMATLPGFYFRSQYFVLFLPGLCLLGGVFLSLLVCWVPDKTGRWPAPLARAIRLSPLVIPLLLIGSFYYQLRAYYFTLPSDLAVRQVYGPNPFPESRIIGDYLRRNSEPTDRLAIIGSEPQIYFYSRLQGATGYIYVYPLIEDHEHAETMTQEMIDEAPPAPAARSPRSRCCGRCPRIPRRRRRA